MFFSNFIHDINSLIINEMFKAKLIMVNWTCKSKRIPFFIPGEKKPSRLGNIF